MIIRRALQSYLIVAAAWSFAADPLRKTPTPSEVDLLSHPRIAVALLYGSSVEPVLAVLVERKLYYADAFPRGSCIGRDLYVLNLEDRSRKEIKVAEVPCIESIQEDGKRPYLVARQDGGKGIREVLQLTDEGLVPALGASSEWNSAFSWRRHQMQSKTGVPWFDSQPLIQYFAVSRSSTSSMVFSNPQQKGDILVMRHSRGSAKRSSSQAQTIHMTFDAAALSAVAAASDGAGTVYIPVRDASNEQLSRILAIPAKEEMYWLGGKSPWTESTPWEKLDATGDNAWMMRSVRVASMPDGLIIHDRTEYQNEWNSLALFSPATKKMTRIAIPQELVDGIEGISLAEGGLLISNPLRGQVFWFGQKSPFSASIFPPRDLDLRILDEEEREQSVAKEGKK